MKGGGAYDRELIHRSVSAWFPRNNSSSEGNSFNSPKCTRLNRVGPRSNVRFGSKADMTTSNLDVRFTPESGHCSGEQSRYVCFVPEADITTYSITSSARARSDGGMVKPIAFAVVRLIAKSNLVGCSTGKSPGFAPRKILSTKSAARRNRCG